MHSPAIVVLAIALVMPGCDDPRRDPGTRTVGDGPLGFVMRYEPAGPDDPIRAGVVVEYVSEGSPAGAAGLLAGDRIYGWEYSRADRPDARDMGDVVSWRAVASLYRMIRDRPEIAGAGFHVMRSDGHHEVIIPVDIIRESYARSPVSSSPR